MNTRERKEIVYRTLPIKAWAQYVPPKNQNQRELLIAIDKIQRLWWQDEFHFMVRLDSSKRSEKIAQKKFQTMGSTYEKVLKRVEQAFHDIAKRSGKRLLAAELKELMYGENGLITEAHEYAKVHTTKG